MSEKVTIYLGHVLIDVDRNLFEDILYAAIGYEENGDYVTSPIIDECTNILSHFNEKGDQK